MWTIEISGRNLSRLKIFFASSSQLSLSQQIKASLALHRGQASSGLSRGTPWRGTRPESSYLYFLRGGLCLHLLRSFPGWLDSHLSDGRRRRAAAVVVVGLLRAARAQNWKGFNVTFRLTLKAWSPLRPNTTLLGSNVSKFVVWKQSNWDRPLQSRRCAGLFSDHSITECESLQEVRLRLFKLGSDFFYARTGTFGLTLVFVSDTKWSESRLCNLTSR